jgi:hypothetical protein
MDATRAINFRHPFTTLQSATLSCAGCASGNEGSRYAKDLPVYRNLAVALALNICVDPLQLGFDFISQFAIHSG